MKFLCSVQETPVWRARLAFPARKKSKIEEFIEKKGKENAFVGPLCVTLLNKKIFSGILSTEEWKSIKIITMMVRLYIN